MAHVTADRLVFSENVFFECDVLLCVSRGEVIDSQWDGCLRWRKEQKLTFLWSDYPKIITEVNFALLKCYKENLFF